MKTYQEAFKEWQALALNVRERGSRLDRSVQDQGWALAATVGIPRCGCCLHNASIDDGLTGWCYQNPTRLAVAKQANHLTNQWPGSRLADRIVRLAWNRIIATPFGFCAYTV